jgi:hypothetical protein
MPRANWTTKSAMKLHSHPVFIQKLAILVFAWNAPPCYREISWLMSSEDANHHQPVSFRLLMSLIDRKRFCFGGQLLETLAAFSRCRLRDMGEGVAGACPCSLAVAANATLSNCPVHCTVQ